MISFEEQFSEDQFPRAMARRAYSDALRDGLARLDANAAATKNAVENAAQNSIAVDAPARLRRLKRLAAAALIAFACALAVVAVRARGAMRGAHQLKAAFGELNSGLGLEKIATATYLDAARKTHAGWSWGAARGPDEKRGPDQEAFDEALARSRASLLAHVEFLTSLRRSSRDGTITVIACAVLLGLALALAACGKRAA